MISAHLPAGTKIVCIDASVRPDLRAPGIIYHNNLHGLQAGASYTIRRYDIDELSNTVVVLLAEIDRTIGIFRTREAGYDLSRFNLLKQLPASILECLNVKAPVRERELVSTASHPNRLTQIRRTM